MFFKSVLLQIFNCKMNNYQLTYLDSKEKISNKVKPNNTNVGNLLIY